MKSIQEKIAVMQAHADGEAIEVCCGDGEWILVPNPRWDWRARDYRVKEKPLIPVPFCAKNGRVGFAIRGSNAYRAYMENPDWTEMPTAPVLPSMVSA